MPTWVGTTSLTLSSNLSMVFTIDAGIDDLSISFDFILNSHITIDTIDGRLNSTTPVEYFFILLKYFLSVVFYLCPSMPSMEILLF